MGTHTQQRELWIYLSIVWWIGSLAAWLMAWISGSSSGPNDSFLTAAALLMFGVSACLRLPVLTTQTPTTLIEDHFVWLLTASANVNWLGYVLLHASSVSAIIPAAVIGFAIEWWSWNQACKSDCLSWARNFIRDSIFGKAKLPTAIPLSSKSVEESAAPLLPSPRTTEDVHDEGNIVQRTIEDGIDPTGRRYLAGEVTVSWSKEQHIQTIVVGFVPAFSGNPEVEFEVNCEFCSAQIVNCSPAGMRIQLKRSNGATEAERLANLSWYAKQTDILESEGSPCTASLN